MPAIKYRVALSEDEKGELEAMLRKGKSVPRAQTRARMLLKVAAGGKDEEITQGLGVSASMVAKAPWPLPTRRGPCCSGRPRWTAAELGWRASA
jgi:hypothetical protein